ncbi:MAG: hypothetical protein ABSB70_04120 [Candidatus Velthaea sp.]
MTGKRIDTAGPIDSKDIGAHVGKQHRRERRRADPGKFDNAHICESAACFADGRLGQGAQRVVDHSISSRQTRASSS